MSARAQRKKKTRAALLQAARACIVTAGYEELTIGAISRAAGVAHGTFYVHFESKDAILDALLEDFNSELDRRVGALMADVSSGVMPERRALLERVADVVIGHWDEERAFVACYAERVGHGLAVRALRDGVSPPMLRLVRGALALLSNGRAVEPAVLDLIAQGVLALWLRLILQLLFGEGVERPQAVRTLVAMTLGAVDAALAPYGGTP